MAGDEDIVKPTRERLRRAVGLDEVVETTTGGITRKNGAVRVWSQLENLYRNNRLTPEQHQAGLKYYADWYLSIESRARVTMRWSEYISGLGGSGNMDAAERRVFHGKRWAEANKRLEDIGMRKAIHWLVINDVPCEQIGRKFWGYKTKHKASASATTAAALALQLLAKFYGLVK